jgi:hypothetical protein
MGQNHLFIRASGHIVVVRYPSFEVPDFENPGLAEIDDVAFMGVFGAFQVQAFD